MSRTSLFSVFSFAALALGLTIPAGATTVTLTTGLFSTQAGAVNTTFDSTTPGFVFSPTTSGIATGSTVNLRAAPTADTTAYAWVTTGGSIVDTFAAPVSYLGLYWGSPDTYNTLIITDVNGVATSYIPGSGLLAGLTANQSTAQYVNFFDTGAAWASVTFLSSTAAFEFDNVATIAATTTATPEPASIALLAGGLLVVGIKRRRKAA